jgi:hypothetical protein
MCNICNTITQRWKKHVIGSRGRIKLPRFDSKICLTDSIVSFKMLWKKILLHLSLSHWNNKQQDLNPKNYSLKNSIDIYTKSLLCINHKNSVFV